MIFRRAVPDDLASMLETVSRAQLYLKEHGIDQWQNGYPDSRQLVGDISGGISYLLCSGDELCCMAAVTLGLEDPTYTVIDSGSWLSGEGIPYGVIHRFAVSDVFRGKGIAGMMILHIERLCLENGISFLRADTHSDNLSMRHVLEKAGFSYRGIIYLADGAPRSAYEKQLVHPAVT